MNLPPQHPDTPPRYRFRPRNDHYTAPTFRAPLTPRITDQPWEPFPDNEPRDLDWAELREPGVILGGFAMFMAGLAIVVIVFLSSVA